MREDLVLADVGVPGSARFGAGGAGVPVAAAVGGPAGGPGRFQPPPAPPAGQQPGQQVPPRRRASRPAGRGRILGGDEISLADQRRMRGPLGDHRSWRAGSLLEDTTSTFAEGLATRTAFELPQRILRELLDDFVLVSEEALKAATRLMIEKTHNLVEPAGAAALAAVLDAPGRFADRKVALICSGGNISPAQLVELWPRGTT